LSPQDGEEGEIGGTRGRRRLERYRFEGGRRRRRIMRRE